ncbi:transmembrane emp24 domain-containing protein 4-like [Lepisosteus oculatus]|uniref:transmembrane emp24 domain-containing protein 4-like n=1 Tax=Lepisosteus oculatus TaxID=7918 RepID=UPI00073FC85A|nr:PREDICTED: transmembrane emp24 domain-containing protein 4-like [Lepisosteus oculatus]
MSLFSQFVCLFLLATLSLTRALYFHIGETEKKCFIEEIPDETMVIGKYRIQLWDKQSSSFLPSTPGLGMHVEVADPGTKIMLSRQYGSEGCFTFTSFIPGEHRICLYSNSTKMALFAGGKLRVHLDIKVGAQTNNYAKIAAKDKLTEIQLRVRQLLDQVEQIQMGYDYQRYREERFRMTSKSTNYHVLWWSIAQTIILIITGIWLRKDTHHTSDVQKVKREPPQASGFGSKQVKVDSLASPNVLVSQATVFQNTKDQNQEPEEQAGEENEVEFQETADLLHLFSDHGCQLPKHQCCAPYLSNFVSSEEALLAEHSGANKRLTSLLLPSSLISGIKLDKEKKVWTTSSSGWSS